MLAYDKQCVSVRSRVHVSVVKITPRVDGCLQLHLVGAVDGWAYVINEPLFVSGVVWVTLHWVLSVGLALLTLFHFFASHKP